MTKRESKPQRLDRMRREGKQQAAVIAGAKDGAVYFRKCLTCGKPLEEAKQAFCSAACSRAHKGTEA